MSASSPTPNGGPNWLLVGLVISSLVNVTLLVMGVYVEARMDARLAVQETLMRDRIGMPERAKALEEKTLTLERHVEKLEESMNWMMRNIIRINAEPPSNDD